MSGQATEVTDSRGELIRRAAEVCRSWQEEGLDTIAVVCRNQQSAEIAAAELKQYVEIMESDLEKAEFGNGILVLPVEYTKGLEFDAVLILDPTREDYPLEDGHAKLLYVAATRALHQLCVLHTGDLTGLIADPVPDKKPMPVLEDLAAEALAKIRTSTRTPDQPTTCRPQMSSPLPPKAATAPTKSKVVITSAPTGHTAKLTSSGMRPATDTHTTPNTGIASNMAKVSPSAVSASTTKVPRPGTKPAGGTNTVGGSNPPSPPGSAVFGDMPPTEKLRPPGHPKIDLAIRWVSKQSDGLYLQSRYGVLRLSPVSSGIIRVTFAKGNQLLQGVHPRIAVTKTERAWMYKDSSKTVELVTDELCLQVDKTTGALRYLTRDKKLLLAERTREARQVEDLPGSQAMYSSSTLTPRSLGASAAPSKGSRNWLYLDWQKEEKLYGLGDADTAAIPLRGTARYLSQNGLLPFLLSDKGYGILLASDGPAFACDIPTYGSYLYTEGTGQMDYYFIVGKQAGTILSAFDYLCGI